MGCMCVYVRVCLCVYVAGCVEAVKVSQQFHFLCGFPIHIFSPFSQQIDKQIFAGKTAEKF